MNILICRIISNRSLDADKRDVQTYYESLVIGASNLKMILYGLRSDIHGLQKRKLDQEIYFVIFGRGEVCK